MGESSTASVLGVVVVVGAYFVSVQIMPRRERDRKQFCLGD